MAERVIFECDRCSSNEEDGARQQKWRLAQLSTSPGVGVLLRGTDCTIEHLNVPSWLLCPRCVEALTDWLRQKERTR
jgi:hypothetical protein